MQSNLSCYKRDLESLIQKGNDLLLALKIECFPENAKKILAKLGKNSKDIPSFYNEYQSWYSEAMTVVKQLLPDRFDDFVNHYKKPKVRKNINFESYRIEDFLQRVETRTVNSSIAIPHFEQQLAILKSAEKIFESSLFRIQQLVQADLFDSEIAAATELIKHKFNRSAGALAGVVLERHLKQVCNNHNVKVTKKNPNIADLNNILKNAGIIEMSTWRFIQYLADVRNLCDHDKNTEPNNDEVSDLINGVKKIIKTVF